MEAASPEAAHWSAPAEDVLAALGTRAEGLSRREAARRLHRHGPNLLRTKKPRSACELGKIARLAETLPELREEPFDPETRMMATLHRGAPPASPSPEGRGIYVAVKGAVEPVLGACTYVATAEGPVALDEARRAEWLDHHDALAQAGLRVLALADKHVGDPAAPPYSDLPLGPRPLPRADSRKRCTMSVVPVGVAQLASTIGGASARARTSHTARAPDAPS